MRRAGALLLLELANQSFPFPTIHPLDFLFPDIGLTRMPMGFKVDEIRDVISCCITVRVVLCSMFVQAPFEIVRDPGVEKSAETVTQDVDIIHSHALLLPQVAPYEKGHEVERNVRTRTTQKTRLRFLVNRVF